MEMEVTHYIVSKETGEIIDQLKVGDKVIKKENQEKQKEYFDTYETEFNKDKRFVKMFEGMNEVRKILTGSEALILLGMLDFVSYDDGIIRKGGHGNGKILTVEELADEMDVNYSTIRKTISSLTKKGIIGIHKTGCRDNPNLLIKSIIVNPYIFMRGTKMNKTILGLFEDANWNVNILDTEKSNS